MTKNITRSPAAVLLAMCLLLCGCKPRMIADKYKATVHDDYLTYSTASAGYLSMMQTTPMSAENGLKQYEYRMEPYFDQLDKIFFDLRSLRPPKEFDSVHKKLVDSLELEEEMLQLMRDLFATETKEDAVALTERFYELSDRQAAAEERGESFAAIAGQISRMY